MKKLREMKKNNKGFSLVELIVVIAIMVVLVAVLGSTILGYIDESKYAKDIQALDSVDTAVGLLVADPDSDWSLADNKVTTLKALMEYKVDGKEVNTVLENTLKEVFKSDGTFNNSSAAFAGIDTEDVKIKIVNGAVQIYVESQKDGFDDYESPEGNGELS